MEGFKSWQLPIVEMILSGEYTEMNPLRVRDALDHTLSMGEEIGRSSVQVFLKSLVEEGSLNHDTQPARGGYHGVYWLNSSQKLRGAEE